MFKDVRRCYDLHKVFLWIPTVKITLTQRNFLEMLEIELKELHYNEIPGGKT